MKIQLTESQLTEYLDNSSRQDLIDIVLELYRDCEVSRNILNMRFISQEFSTQLLKEYEERIRKVFFPSSSSFKANTGKAERIVNEFLLICPNIADRCRLVLLVLDCEFEITSYGYTSPFFEESIVRMLDTLESLLKQADNKREICELLPDLSKYDAVVDEYYPDLQGRMPQMIQSFCPFAAAA